MKLRITFTLILAMKPVVDLGPSQNQADVTSDGGQTEKLIFCAFSERQNVKSSLLNITEVLDRIHKYLLSIKYINCLCLPFEMLL